MEVTNHIVPVAACAPHPHNYNQHPASQIAALQASLRKFGQVRSIVVQDDDAGGYLIIAGHGVWEAARGVGLQRIKADVIPASWTYTKAVAYLAADNELARLGEVDYEQLALLVKSVADEDAALALLAVGDETKYDELLRLAELDGESLEKKGPSLTPVGDIAEIHERWGAESGDIWQIGDHFLACGDCREAGTWRRVLDVAGRPSVDMAFTSPPYAMQRKSTYGGIPPAEYVAWWELVQEQVRDYSSAAGQFFVNVKPHASGGERALYVMELVLAMRQRWNWLYVDEIIWQKPAFPGRCGKRLRNMFEPIHHFALSLDYPFHAKRRGKKSKDIPVHMPISLGGYSYSVTTGNTGLPKKSKYRTGISQPGNVLTIQVGGMEKMPHPASFPVELPAFFIAIYSEPGQVICDPFSGTGTTILAAAESGRIGVGIEMSPQYVSLTLERFKRRGFSPERVSQCPVAIK